MLLKMPKMPKFTFKKMAVILLMLPIIYYFIWYSKLEKQ